MLSPEAQAGAPGGATAAVEGPPNRRRPAAPMAVPRALGPFTLPAESLCRTTMRLPVARLTIVIPPGPDAPQSEFTCAYHCMIIGK